MEGVSPVETGMKMEEEKQTVRLRSHRPERRTNLARLTSIKPGGVGVIILLTTTIQKIINLFVLHTVISSVQFTERYKVRVDADINFWVHKGSCIIVSHSRSVQTSCHLRHV